MKKFGFAALCTALAVAGLSLSASVSAQAAPAANPADSPLYFPNVDKNHDGSIGRSEVPKDLSDLRTHFDQYDANHDHRLSEAEYVGYLRTLGSAACRDDIHTSTKCAISPYAGDPMRPGYGSDSPAVSPPKAPVGH